MITLGFFATNCTVGRSSAGLLMNCAPASMHSRAVSLSTTVPAPRITWGAFFTKSRITSIAPGTVIVRGRRPDNRYDADLFYPGTEFLFFHVDLAPERSPLRPESYCQFVDSYCIIVGAEGNSTALPPIATQPSQW